MFKLILGLTFISFCIGCSNLSGQISTNPTFEFTFNPPVAWTYFDGTNPNPTDITDVACLTTAVGQSSSSSSALQIAKANIAVSAQTCLSQYGMPSTATFNVITFTPGNVLIKPDSDATCAKPGTYLQEIQAVTKKRITATEKEAYTNVMTLQVNNNINAYYHSQWESLSNCVQMQLTAKYGVLFVGDITITP